ncbi:hypothetical protein [Nocardioides zeae]
MTVARTRAEPSPLDASSGTRAVSPSSSTLPGAVVPSSAVAVVGVGSGAAELLPEGSDPPRSASGSSEPHAASGTRRAATAAAATW